MHNLMRHEMPNILVDRQGEWLGWQLSRLGDSHGFRYGTGAMRLFIWSCGSRRRTEFIPLPAGGGLHGNGTNSVLH